MKKVNREPKFVMNWNHFNLIRDLKAKLSPRRPKDGKSYKETPYKARTGQILRMTLDGFSDDLSDDQCEKLRNELAALVKRDPLSSTGLNRTDNLRKKFFPYFRRNSPLTRAKPALVKYLKSPEIPVMLVRNVWAIDLGMSNSVENRQALSDIGWNFPDHAATKTMRLASFGLTLHHVFGYKSLEARDPSKKGRRGVRQVELLLVPVTLMDNMVGFEREDGSRSTANLPESWRRWQNNEVEEALRLGRSARASEPTKAKVTRTAVKPKGGQPAKRQLNRGNRSGKPPQKEKEDSSPIEVLRKKHGFMTVKELRNLCTDNKVIRGGNKDDLLVRLYDLGVLDL